MNQILRLTTIETTNKTVFAEGASEIEFINKGNSCKIKDIPLEFGESQAFTSPIFGAIDLTKYEIIFETNNSLDNKLIIVRTVHTT